MYSVTGNKNGRIDEKKKKLYAFCDQSKFVEISEKVKFYLSHYEKEEDLFWSAFIHKNHIFPVVDPSKKVDQEDVELTREQKEKFMKMRELMNGMTKAQFLKTLNSPTK